MGTWEKARRMKKQVLSDSHAYDGESEIKLPESKDRQLLFTPNTVSPNLRPELSEEQSKIAFACEPTEPERLKSKPEPPHFAARVCLANKETIQAPYKYSTVHYIPVFHNLQQMNRSFARIRGAY
jgi:hypothetical protein